MHGKTQTTLFKIKRIKKNRPGRLKKLLKKENQEFFRQFLLNYRKTGAIAASSEKLGKKFIESANIEDADCVVELGSGNGVLTEKIQQHLKPGATFFAMEINPYFVKKTQARCPDVTVYQDSADRIRYYLKQHGVEGCDCVISGLPWSLFSKSYQETLLSEIFDSLIEGGDFLTFAYIHGIYLPSGRVYRKALPDIFKEVQHSKIVWNNAPPAIVYKATK